MFSITKTDKTVITNNKLVYECYSKDYEILYDEALTFLGVLQLVRDKIHSGHKLLTHPLSGSIKPNETPYKTVIVARKRRDLDLDSLKIIEDSIETSIKFLKNTKLKNYSEKIHDDFRLIDFSLIKESVERNI